MLYPFNNSFPLKHTPKSFYNASEWYACRIAAFIRYLTLTTQDPAVNLNNLLQARGETHLLRWGFSQNGRLDQAIHYATAYREIRHSLLHTRD